MQTRALGIFFTLLAAGSVFAGDKHMGVATCAGSACHGAARISGGNVRQNEYLRWQREERHSRAFATLRNERSQRIAANLGIGPPTEAYACLVCHSDLVPDPERGERYHVTDGVGCEACHGGSERWLSPHVRGYGPNHRDRLAAGLYPTWEPQARAELCLSCHQGDAKRPMTHAIMGAGHPPLLFELDTFVALQPAHFEVDADYVARKGRLDDARLWIVGQSMAARGMLAGVGTAAQGDALFPELVWFDCNACHHAMQPPRWEPRPGVSAGRVRLADTSLHFTGLWLDVVQPALGSRWREELRQLHVASGQTAAALRDRAATLGKLLEAEVMPLAAKHEHTPAQLRALALSLTEQGPHMVDFSVAEQTAMATAVFATALGQTGNAKPGKPLQSAIDEVYKAVEHRDRYDPTRMRAALRSVRDEITKTYK